MMTRDQYDLLIGGSCDCCIGKGHVDQGHFIVAGHAPLRGTAVFVRPQKIILRPHNLGCSELRDKDTRIDTAYTHYFREVVTAHTKKMR